MMGLFMGFLFCLFSNLKSTFLSWPLWIVTKHIIIKLTIKSLQNRAYPDFEEYINGALRRKKVIRENMSGKNIFDNKIPPPPTKNEFLVMYLLMNKKNLSIELDIFMTKFQKH